MKTRLIAAALLAVWLTAGCNTIQGAGRDIEKGGEKVQDAAQNAKKSP